MSSAKIRRPVVAANWKMNLLSRDAVTFARTLGAELSSDPGCDVLIFPPATLLSTLRDHLAGQPVAWGGQDLHPKPSGAFTGDLSGAHLTDFGCTWALCGHSERRRDHGEMDRLVGEKARAANESGLVPLICLGESREQRKAGQTEDTLRQQLRGALVADGQEPPASFELAYEPVWAIGTGETATPEMAQETQAFLRNELASLVGARRAGSTRILYGGSANPENAGSLIAQPDIDGFLIGGASLDSAKFLAMILVCGRAA